ncbi:hypothetical protein NPIL_436911 [Nephila pilipes]|uniref:Uncharacterized protein n=1 Tax=Nephila pilipes TaxID=299642 RepID=A0A8X6IRK4_NEPPI|nr:hypothetical protein NPIL_436911 [Nephila pilipes]
MDITYPITRLLKEESSATKIGMGSTSRKKIVNVTSLKVRLLTRPNIQGNISALLQRWRMFKMVYVVDIEKMYKQIRIRRNSKIDQIEYFKFLILSFGMESSACLTIHTLKQLADGGMAMNNF